MTAISTCQVCGRSDSVFQDLCPLCRFALYPEPFVGARVLDTILECAATVIHVSDTSDSYGVAVTYVSDWSPTPRWRVAPHNSGLMRPLDGRSLCRLCGHYLQRQERREHGRHETGRCPVSPIARAPFSH